MQNYKMNNYKYYLTAVALACFLFSTSCSRKVVRDSTMGPEAPPVPEHKSETVYDEAVGPEIPMGPETPDGYVHTSEGIVLVFPAALARSAAYVAALKVLNQKKIRINGIFSEEFGNLISTLYCSKKQNGMEWEFSKFTNEDISEKGLFKKNARAKFPELNKDLKKKFESQKLVACKPKIFSTEFKNTDDDVTLMSFLEKEKCVEQLNEFIGDKISLDDVSCGSELLEVAKQAEMGKILLVDVLDGSNAAIGQEKITQFYNKVYSNILKSKTLADYWVKIDLREIGFFEISKKAQIYYKTKKQVEGFIKEKGIR